jgi:hypothetical protein
MMTDPRGWLLVLSGLLLLGMLGLLLGVWLERWPWLHRGFLRLGDAAVAFSLGLTGLLMVVLALRVLGWLPVRQ